MTPASGVPACVPECDAAELSPGHLGCKGCGGVLAVRYLLEALGRRTVLVIPASCVAVVDGPAPGHAYGVPMVHCAFAAAASVAVGVRAGLRQQGVDDVTVVAFAGDGGTFDIGLQALSGAAERNEDILYVCYDNEAYMNTGVQRSSATPEGAWTTTTPISSPASEPKRGNKKRIAEIMAAHRIPYIASASIAYPDDYKSKLRRARTIKGLRFLHVFCPCPTGWGCPSDLTVRLAALAVQTRMFPLFEIEGGERWSITHRPSGHVPVGKMLSLQKRFAHLSEGDIAAIQTRTDTEWSALLARHHEPAAAPA